MKKIISLICISAMFVVALSSFTMANAKLPSMTIPKASIKIDGNLSDWKSVKSLYSFTSNQDGSKNLFVHTMKVAWDGVSKLYVTGTIKEPAVGIKNSRKQNAPDWWNDDAFEVFIQPTLPKTLVINQKTALHYAVGEKYIFKAPASFGVAALQTNEICKIIHLKNNQWSFEMSIPLKGTALTRVKMGKEIYLLFGVELNSAGEFSIIGNGKTGAFWTPSNYVKATFKK